jgi:hypothetical protein
MQMLCHLAELSRNRRNGVGKYMKNKEVDTLFFRDMRVGGREMHFHNP